MSFERIMTGLFIRWKCRQFFRKPKLLYRIQIRQVLSFSLFDNLTNLFASDIQITSTSLGLP
ncbi:hypothetical protein BPUM_0618 [Bacillus pumilus SAFR-032]|uniref:Uncharacterized protein n=1 Tax=Bacillus pumilus (strain SAFR-032) TaxID=315750 RepID=A8FAP3_BACP2|nr:hypothetical protein BPUM_0618 [Bacillus pumilus SAFR-032]